MNKREKGKNFSQPFRKKTPKVISFDAFGTLFDFDGIKHQACRKVMERERVCGEAADFFKDWSNAFLPLFERIAEREPRFLTIREITRMALAEILPLWGGEGEARKGTKVWFQSLKEVDLFPEVEEILEGLKGRFRFCIVSDIDNDVLFPVLKRFDLPIDFIFTSEAFQAYKVNPSRSPFTFLFKRMGVKGREVLHVGDMESDIIGAKRQGIPVVLVNRRAQFFRTAPDFEIKDLRGLLDLVNR